MSGNAETSTTLISIPVNESVFAPAGAFANSPQSAKKNQGVFHSNLRKNSLIKIRLAHYVDKEYKISMIQQLITLSSIGLEEKQFQKMQDSHIDIATGRDLEMKRIRLKQKSFVKIW